VKLHGPTISTLLLAQGPVDPNIIPCVGVYSVWSLKMCEPKPMNLSLKK